MKYIGVAIEAAFLIASCTVPSPTANTIAPTEIVAAATHSHVSADIQWLKANAIPFDTAEPNNSLEDLEPLKEMIGDARIVALGEATHGTHEFFQMKHRLLKFLVEEMGFNTFAIEANWSEANLLNDYVRTGKGDPAELLKGLYFWTWNTQEVLDMIQWMRAYNENPAHTSKVSFLGFDMQFDQMARNNVSQYMQEVDPQAAKQITDDYSCYPQFNSECQRKLQAAYDWLCQHQTDYVARTSSEAFMQALHSARIVIQYSDYSSHNNDFYSRDRYMAENVTWLLNQAGPNAKMVLWAHNVHVGMTGDETYLSMGNYLRKQYGNQIVVFGFLFYQGSFNSYGSAHLQAFEVELPPTNSYEYYFHRASLPRFFLDLRSVRTDDLSSDWLLTPHPFRILGSFYNPDDAQLNFRTAALARVFDVIIYFQDTSPSQLLAN